MDLERLGDLVADALDRVERGHRILEDHGDLGSPEATQLIGRRIEDLLALVAD